MRIPLFVSVLFLAVCGPYCLVVSAEWDASSRLVDSPFRQHLPDCRKSTAPQIQRQSNIKVITCPMVKDEKGFLSEWYYSHSTSTFFCCATLIYNCLIRVAYHSMHGIDHFRFYDDSSSANDTFAELDPWIKDETVTIIPANIRNGISFKAMMWEKMNRESNCKLFAFENGYDLLVSIDLDEYLIPNDQKLAAVDEIWQMMLSTGYYFAKLDKWNFNSVPHLLEPVNLLTIEAYHSRMPSMGAMTFFKTVYAKSALRLTGPEYEHKENQSVIKNYVRLCNFHGCFAPKRPPFSNISGLNRIFMTSPRSNFPQQAPVIFHYSRSLEKFSLKARSWRTSGGVGYNLIHFLDRNIGWVYDDRAIMYGCQVRKILRERSGKAIFYRPGDFWYRNVEFGLPFVRVNYSDGTSVSLSADKVKGQPYHYLGEEWPLSQPQ